MIALAMRSKSARLPTSFTTTWFSGDCRCGEPVPVTKVSGTEGLHDVLRRVHDSTAPTSATASFMTGLSSSV
jgi:hypothetical protein